MQIRQLVIVAAGLLVLTSRTAAAQGAGKTGVTMGYPASIGIIWHAGDKVAIRPELTFSGGSSKSTNPPASFDNSNWSVGTGASLLFYLHTYDHLKTYFSPRLTYSRTSSTTNNNTGANSVTAKNTSANTGGSGSFGAQYGVSDKFSVFGEVGIGVNHTTGSTAGSTAKSTGNSWNTRSGVGVILYF